MPRKRKIRGESVQCEIQWNKIKQLCEDAIDPKSENNGTPPAKIPKLEIKDESAFILPFGSNTCCPTTAVSLEGETSSCSNPKITEPVFDLQRRIHSEKGVQCEIQWNKIKQLCEDAIDPKSENNGTPPAKIPKLEIKDESAFILPFGSNTCCPTTAVSLEGETSSCSNPKITEPVFDLQRRIHSEKGVQCEIQWNKIKQLSEDAVDLKSENNGTQPAKIPKLGIKDEPAFILPFVSNTCCPTPAVSLEGETSSCSNPKITEPVFDLQRRIHSEKGVQCEIQWNKIKQLSEDAVDLKSENNGTQPAKIPKLGIKDEPAFILPFVSNTCCPTPAVSLEGETSSCSNPKITEPVFDLQRRIHSEKDVQCEIQWNKIKQLSEDAIDLKSENNGTPPAEIPKLEIKDESAFILPFGSNTCCPTPAVSLEGETSSCSNPKITEPVFDLQRRIHSEKDPQESVLFSPEIMENIFRMLDLAEQNRFRLVCKQWNKMAHEYWLESSFNCKEKIEELKRMSEDDLNRCFVSLLSLIKERPLLKSITCNFDDHRPHCEIIEAVLLYVEDLHHIDMGYATLSQVKSLVTKYKKLKSVSLHFSNHNIVELVKCLGKCKKLEDLILSKDGDSKDDHIERDFPAVCRAIAENYPGLKNLSLMPVMSLQMCEQLEYLLRRRSTTFSRLYLEFQKYSNDIGNVLGLCTNLERLWLRLHSPDIPFQLSGLNKLKELCISFKGCYTREVVAATLASIQDTGPQSYLSLVLLDSTSKTSYTTHLKRHQLRIFDTNTAVNELNNISDLKNVLYIAILGKYITENITRIIAKCKSLEFLALEHCTLTENALLELKHSTNLNSLILFDTKLTLNSIIQVVKFLPNLEFLYVPKSGYRSLDILRAKGLLGKDE